MDNDPRYYDLAPRLKEVDADWDQVTDYLNLWSLHPFRDIEAVQESELVNRDARTIKIWDGPGKLADGSMTPDYFRVHVGAVEFMCNYLGLHKIRGHDALMENLENMTKPYNLPKVERTQAEYDRVLEECKRLYSLGWKKTFKKERDRLCMIAQMVDMDQSVRKNYS